MTVGDRIREKRLSLHLGQSELADKVDISKQTLYKYENNIITNIPSNTLERLANALHTSPAYLMGWDLPKVNAHIIAYSKSLLELMDAADGCSDDQLKTVAKMLNAFKQQNEKEG